MIPIWQKHNSHGQSSRDIKMVKGVSAKPFDAGRIWYGHEKILSFFAII